MNFKETEQFSQKYKDLKKVIRHLYVHVPFCSSICYYCDFSRRIYDSEVADRWLAHLEQEISENCFNSYETIYIGGGTPSCISDSQLEKLLSLIDPYTDKVTEYTVEANPESLNDSKIDLLRKYHVNRISIGVQSSDDGLLRSLNRQHSFQDVKDRIALLKSKGMNNISVDLMYSLPSQSMDMLGQTLDDILELDVPHTSLYSLTIEENSVFGKKNVRSLDEEIEADMYEMITDRLEQNGYLHYEVSNFAKAGYESRHNMGYWNYDDFLGISLGASGKIGEYRYTNTRSFERYFKDVKCKEEEVFLDKEDMMFENIMMSLRTIYGLDIEEFNRKYGCSLLERYEKGISNPYIKAEKGRLICTNLELLNSVLIDFMD